MANWITNDDVRRWSLLDQWETSEYRKVVISVVARSGTPRLVLMHLRINPPNHKWKFQEFICIKRNPSGNPEWLPVDDLNAPGWAREAYENYKNYGDGEMPEPDFSLDEISAGAALIEEIQKG